MNTRRHEALWFWGRGRERSCFNCIFYGEPSYPHLPTHSTIQYIITRPSPYTQQPPKYRICSMKNSYLKPETYAWFYLQCMILMDMLGMGEKKPRKNIYTRKTRKKFPVWFPSRPPVYKFGGRLFSGSKIPETSRTYPRWAGFLLYRDKRIKRVGLGMGR